MKIIGFVLSLFITLGLTVALSVKIESIPPLGYFLDPFHGFWQNAEPRELYIEPALDGGVSQPVRVLYDSLLIPHIFAQNDYDLYWTQGFVQASHRLWQMEFITHVAAGRVSEIVGERAVQFDRAQRRKGLFFAAENAWQAIQDNETARAISQAYSDGINAYINTLSYEEYPLEYKLLNYRPEPWSPVKSALLLKYMAEDLASADEDLENTNALKLFGKETLDRYFPVFLPGRDPIIPTSKQWDFEALTIDTPQVVFRDTSFYTETIAELNPDNGSNNWAVSGDKTRTGYPILANDPHLGLNLPSIWYLVQLNAPGVNVFGATLPGSPGVVIGFNDSIAWGVTNARRDVKDWYKISFTNDTQDEYLFGDRRLKTQRRIEEIRVNRGNTVYDTVMYTHYGPIVYDQSFPADQSAKVPYNYAMKWVAHEGSLELLTFYHLNRSKNYTEYINALKYYRSPAQNFVFASASNDIAIWVQGAFPAKWREQGRFLMDGSRPEQEWQAFIPSEQNPYVLNPERGFVSSANQVPVDTTYPYYVYDHSYEHFRNRRINQQLATTRRATAETMMELQNDVYNQKAADVLPQMLDSLELSELEPDEKDLYDLLRKWNLRNSVNQTAPTVFKVWWDTFYDLVWDEFISDEFLLEAPDHSHTIFLMQHHPNDTIFDSQATSVQETLDDIIMESFRETSRKLAAWQEKNEKEYSWGDYKATSVQHMLQIPEFSVMNVPVGGGRNIVSANSSRHGASWKMIVELGPELKAWGVYPGGQSGNPGSHFYTNLLPTWARGQYFPIQLYSDGTERSPTIMSRQVINPSTP